jgi:arylsulfatase B
MYFAPNAIHKPYSYPSGEGYEQACQCHNDNGRQEFCGVGSALDKSIGDLLAALQSKSRAFWENTVVVFASDNGGLTAGANGFNYPFRAGKGTLFEGAVHVPAVVYSPLIKKPGRAMKEMMHVTDW